MMLKNKSILLPKDATDGIRVCVMNSIHPEYQFDCWLPCLAPSRSLVEAYVINKEISWDEFSNAYLREQAERDNHLILQSLAALIKQAHQENQDVTLLCFEEEISHCHRQLIIEALIPLIGKQLIATKN